MVVRWCWTVVVKHLTSRSSIRPTVCSSEKPSWRSVQRARKTWCVLRVESLAQSEVLLVVLPRPVCAQIGDG